MTQKKINRNQHIGALPKLKGRQRSARKKTHITNTYNMRRYQITIPAFTEEIHAKDKDEALEIFLFDYDVARQEPDFMQPHVLEISPRLKTVAKQKTIQEHVAEWIDTQVIVEGIDNALDSVGLLKTKVNFKEVWLMHLEKLWELLEAEAESLKEKQARNAEKTSK